MPIFPCVKGFYTPWLTQPTATWYNNKESHLRSILHITRKTSPPVQEQHIYWIVASFLCVLGIDKEIYASEELEKQIQARFDQPFSLICIFFMDIKAQMQFPPRMPPPPVSHYVEVMLCRDAMGLYSFGYSFLCWGVCGPFVVV